MANRELLQVSLAELRQRLDEAERELQAEVESQAYARGPRSRTGKAQAKVELYRVLVRRAETREGYPQGHAQAVDGRRAG